MENRFVRKVGLHRGGKNKTSFHLTLCDPGLQCVSRVTDVNPDLVEANIGRAWTTRANQKFVREDVVMNAQTLYSEGCPLTGARSAAGKCLPIVGVDSDRNADTNPFKGASVCEPCEIVSDIGYTDARCSTTDSCLCVPKEVLNYLGGI